MAEDSQKRLDVQPIALNIINWVASAQFIKLVDFFVKKLKLSMINPVTKKLLRDP